MAATTNLAASPQAAPAKACKIAIVGFGTVGSSVARLLCARASEHPFQLTHVYNRGVSRKKVDWVPGDVQWTENIEDVLNSDAEVVLELVGGVNPAGDWVRKALQAGKSVVTANKQLIAHHGTELISLARQSGQHLAFGAAVAGGIPILSALHDGLGGDRLQKIRGILNGTCNYILTRIESTGCSFDQALKEAQVAGFAEADPTDDTEGFDARAKLVILARVGLKAEVPVDRVVCHSISKVQEIDFGYAHQLGCTIRQISRVEVQDGHLYAAVEPALVPQSQPLAHVSGSQNLVVSTGEFGGETVFAGFGAGGNPTAVAVVSDLFHILRNKPSDFEFANEPLTNQYPASGNFDSPYYVRFNVNDKPGIIAALAGVFAKYEINIDSLLQMPNFTKKDLPFVITLESCRTGRLRDALTEMSKFEFLNRAPVCMPILR